jgi:hypothetical protein
MFGGKMICEWILKIEVQGITGDFNSIIDSLTCIGESLTSLVKPKWIVFFNQTIVG